MTVEQDDINALPVIPNDLRNLMDLLTSSQELFAPFLRQARGGLLPDATGAGGLDNPDALAMVADNLNAASLNAALAAPFFGQANLLPDPTFEQLSNSPGTQIPTVAGTIGDWKYQRVVNSGTSPQFSSLVRVPRGHTANPYNSAIARLQFTGNMNAGDTTWYLWPMTDYSADLATLLPYLLGSVKMADLGISANDYTNVTSLTVRLQLMNATDTVVVAEAPIFDVKANLNHPAQAQSVVAYPIDEATFRSKDWRWRIRVDMVTSASGSGGIAIDFGEPILRLAYTPDGGGPYAPQIARWSPNQLSSRSNGINEEIVAVYRDDEGVARFIIDSFGNLLWGDGSAAVDTVLQRTAAGILGTTGTFTAATLDGGILRLDNAVDVSLSSTAHPFQIGDSGSTNLAMDGNEIMARNNGAVSPLALNGDGGRVSIGQNISATTSATDGIIFGSDVTLFRGGTDVLATEDHFRLDSGRLRFASTINPAQLTANQDNWNPTGLATANTIRIQTDATPRTITGIVAGADGDIITLHNRNSATAITLAHDVTSTGANRFYCPGAVNFSLQPKQSVRIQYSSADSRWLVIA